MTISYLENNTYAQKFRLLYKKYSFYKEIRSRLNLGNDCYHVLTTDIQKVKIKLQTTSCCVWV